MKNKNKGFTLLELILVVALMSIIYTITITNYNGMNKNIDLRNTVYLVASYIREAQIYGINKKIINDPNNDEIFSDNNNFTYGIHFDITSENKKRKIIIFKDLNDNHKFDGDCSLDKTECEQIILLNNGIRIGNLWLYNNNWYNKTKINILFKRPDPDALIYEDGGKTKYSEAKIMVINKLNKSGCIYVGSAGDITIKNNCN